jgi:uncharacterized protein
LIKTNFYRRARKGLLIVVALFISSLCFSQNAFDPESLLKPGAAPQKLVTDFTKELTPDQISALEAKLVAFDDSTSTQIAVVIVPTVGNYDIADYNTKLGRAWGVGGKEFSNGVILLVAKDDRKLNIATGYGVEGALPDITAGHIIQDIITPQFKLKNYYRGIDDGTDAIISAVKGEYNTPRLKAGKGMPMGRLVMMIVIVVVILSLFSGGNNKGGTFMSRRGSRGISGPFFWPTGGGWSGGSSGGGGWGGGGSSGGFGGFGGGSFGGGGASGSW